MYSVCGEGGGGVMSDMAMRERVGCRDSFITGL